MGPPLGCSTGAALAAKLDGRENIALGVFGDTTSSRDDCHEAMNIAAVRTVPVVFVHQNNQIAISTELGQGVAGSSTARGASFGIPSVEVDGNDVTAVKHSLDSAVANARHGDGSSLINCQSYRGVGHFYSDAKDYQDQKEINRWRQKDSLTRFRAHLIAEGIQS